MSQIPGDWSCCCPASVAALEPDFLLLVGLLPTCGSRSKGPALPAGSFVLPSTTAACMDRPPVYPQQGAHALVNWHRKCLFATCTTTGIFLPFLSKPHPALVPTGTCPLPMGRTGVLQELVSGQCLWDAGSCWCCLQGLGKTLVGQNELGQCEACHKSQGGLWHGAMSSWVPWCTRVGVCPSAETPRVSCSSMVAPSQPCCCQR